MFINKDEINFKKYDIVIIGAGISGSVIAERYANLRNKKILIIDKRDHIAGNCYDYKDKDNVLIHKYGPHIFHTNYEDVWDYVNKFANFNNHELRVVTAYNGLDTVPIPVNIDTVNKIWDANLKTESDMIDWLSNEVENIENPKNSEESIKARMGERIYELLFKNYFKKQWDKWPSEVDALVSNRIPIRTNHDDRYFTDKYQGLPVDGYTELFKKMISHENIDILLNTDYFDLNININDFEKVFFTGPIDRFFEFKFGKLEYRSLEFKFETYKQEYFQDSDVVAYPNTEDFTRCVEYKKLTGQKSEYTTVSREYPTWNGDPYYPVPNKKNQDLYLKYQAEANELEEQSNGKVYFVGRLANYKYFNMDQTFKNALDLFNKIENI